MTPLGGGAQRRFCVKIDLEKQMKTLLQEAEVYKSQGLLAEAKAAFGSVAQLIQENEQFAHKTGLLEEISKVMSAVDDDISRIKKAAASPTISAEEQAVIRELFSFSSYITLPQQKGPVSYFSEVTDKAVSHAVEPEDVGDKDEEGEQLLEISLLEMPLENGPHLGKRVDIEVDSQVGNNIKILISQQDKELMDHLRVGFRINDVRFYAPFATFKGAAFVIARNRINSGIRKGNCVVDIKIVAR